MSRKGLKRKRRSCALCKPGKTSQSNRWTAKDEALLKRFEKALRDGDWSGQ